MKFKEKLVETTSYYLGDTFSASYGLERGGNRRTLDRSLFLRDLQRE